MAAPAPRPDAAAVSALLAQHIDTLCADMLSAGTRKSQYWTVGSVTNERGKSMWVHLSGGKRGHWQDASTGEFGDALDLVAACRFRGDKKAAYAWALSWLGLDTSGRDVPVPRPAPAARAAPKQDDAAERKRRYALACWLNAAAELRHTPVASYLAFRRIDLAQLGRVPRALRYHPDLPHGPTRMKMPAMVAAISNGDGDHVATHRTWLRHAGGGVYVKAPVPDPKMSIGDFGGGSIRLWRGASKRPLRDAKPEDPVIIGEGIETCLSIALACPEFRVLCGVSLGNMGSVWLPEQVRLVVLAADNDEKPVTRLALQRAAERHIAAGREVRIARSNVGSDFNDALRDVA